MNLSTWCKLTYYLTLAGLVVIASAAAPTWLGWGVLALGVANLAAVLVWVDEVEYD